MDLIVVLPFKGSRQAWIPASYNRWSWTWGQGIYKSHLPTFFRDAACWRLLRYLCLSRVTSTMSFLSSSTAQLSLLFLMKVQGTFSHLRTEQASAHCGSWTSGSMRGHKLLCLWIWEVFVDEQSKPVVLVLFEIVLNSGYRNRGVYKQGWLSFMCMCNSDN